MIDIQKFVIDVKYHSDSYMDSILINNYFRQLGLFGPYSQTISSENMLPVIRHLQYSRIANCLRGQYNHFRGCLSSRNREGRGKVYGRNQTIWRVSSHIPHYRHSVPHHTNNWNWRFQFVWFWELLRSYNSPITCCFPISLATEQSTRIAPTF